MQPRPRFGIWTAPGYRGAARLWHNPAERGETVGAGVIPA